MKRAFDSATCQTCNTYFDRLPVERDEDGGYVVLEVKPCADPNCGLFLCGACSTFQCAGCDQTFCSSHLVLVEDGTPAPLKCCAPCAAECEPLPLPFPPARETRIAIAAKGVA